MSDHAGRSAHGWWFHACALAEVDSDDSWLSDAEAERIASFRFEKRRSETRMSRWTAKCAVGRALGFPVDDWIGNRPAELRRVAIRNHPNGAPEAFVDGEQAGVSISMTDRADWAVCLVAPDPALTVGCDLELIEPRTAGFVADWFTPAERAIVAADSTGSTDLLANLIWSAKESALKVLRTGLRRDTRSVEVQLGVADAVDGWQPLTVTSLDDSDDGAVFTGWWQQFGQFVFTCATDASLDPPRPVTEPPPLATATPAHAWLDTLP